MLLLLLAPSLGLATGFSHVLLLGCGYIGLYLFVHARELMRPGSLRFEALVEGSLYFCGVLAIIYQVMARGT
jgi:hypothetical protein